MSDGGYYGCWNCSYSSAFKYTPAGGLPESMYRILLADDEGIAIDSLTFIIEKQYGSACEIRSAKTGRAVIETAENFRPDVAVMDIQMPGINGMEAMKEIRRFCPDTVFIVLTAYDKFDYAKEAIDLGVFRYLTKPLDRDVFIEVMNGAMAEIDREKERRSRDLRTREKLETVVPVIESGFVYSLLLQESYESDIDQYRSLLEISETHGFIMLIECGDPDDNRMTNPIGTGIRIQNFYGTIRNILKGYNSRAVVGQIIANKIPVLVPTAFEEPDYNTRVNTMERARQTAARLEEKTGAGFRIGIGTVKPFHEMRASYEEAKRSLHTGRDQVSDAYDLPVLCEYEDGYPLDLENQIFDNVKRGDPTAAEDAADRYFAWMEETQMGSEQNIRLKALEFVLWAEHIAYSDGGMGVYRFTDRSEYMNFATTAGMEELHDWFVRKIREAARRISGKSTARAGSLCSIARQYIDTHYQNDISLDDVSRELDISPYYFSKLFKEEAGVTFIEYLTTLRMDKAKELLADKTKSVKDVCAAVGYQDPNYFSRIFKRSVGCTPTEYRG